MKKISLAWQIMIGLIIGIIVGAIFNGNPMLNAYLQPIGDIFIRLIKMIVVPIVFASLVVGIAGSGDIKKVGRLGGKTIIYFEIITTLALALGLIAANVLHPGTGVDMSQLAKGDIQSYVATAKTAGTHSFASTLINIVPTNIIDSMAKGDMLAIIFFAVMFGLGVASIGEKGKPVIVFFQGVAEIMFWVTNTIMKVAPIGVFALIGVTVSKFGVGSLIPLGKLILAVYATVFVFVLVVFAPIAKMVGTSIFTIMKVIKEELILAFSSASSETVLPKIMEKMEKFGCPKSIASFVVPTGYTFNLDGSAIYQALAALFIAQMYGVHMSIGAQITLLVTLMLTSKGMAGVAGASLVVVVTTLGAMGLPLEGLALIAGIDRILDMVRTSLNVLGNSLATVVMSKWEGQFDQNKSVAYLNTLSASATVTQEAAK